MEVLLVKDGAVVLLAGILEGLLRLVGGGHGHQRVLFAAAWTVHDRLLLRESTLFIFNDLRLVVTFLCFDRLLFIVGALNLLLPLSVSAILLSPQHVNRVFDLALADECAELFQPLRLRISLALIDPHLGPGSRMVSSLRAGLQGINVLVVILKILVLPGHIFGCTFEYTLSC